MDGPKYAKSKKAKFFSTPTYVYEKLNAEQCCPWSPLPFFFKIHGPWLIRFRICGRGLHGPKHHLIWVFFPFVLEKWKSVLIFDPACEGFRGGTVIHFPILISHLLVWLEKLQARNGINKPCSFKKLKM